jgi:hypothetical protein
MLTPGQIVKISNLRKGSYFLYKKYLNYSPFLICPCKVKRNKLLTVIEEFTGSIVLLKVNNTDNLTMTYETDLESVYER